MNKQKKLEKRLASLIEGYNTYFFNPANASEINLKEAGEIIQKEIYNSTKEDKAGLIIFDGWVHVILRTCLGTICMGKNTLNIIPSTNNKRGMFIYSPQDGFGDYQNSIYIESKNKCIKEIRPIWTSSISLSIEDKVEQKNMELEFYVDRMGIKTNIFYIPHLRKQNKK